MPKPKATKVEYERRIFAVQGWIVDGQQPALIIQQIINNGWCERRQAERLLRTARERWTQVPDAVIEDKRKLKVAELQQLKKSLKESYKGTPAGIRALMDIEKQIIIIEGLAQAQKHIVAGDKDNPLHTEVKHSVTFHDMSKPYNDGKISNT